MIDQLRVDGVVWKRSLSRSIRGDIDGWHTQSDVHDHRPNYGGWRNATDTEAGMLKVLAETMDLLVQAMARVEVDHTLRDMERQLATDE